MAGGQVAVADYCPNWWPAATPLVIRRVRLGVAHGAGSADPRARRRRTLRPEQRALPLAELDELDAVYGYSFISDLPRRRHRRTRRRGRALVSPPHLDSPAATRRSGTRATH